MDLEEKISSIIGRPFEHFSASSEEGSSRSSTSVTGPKSAESSASGRSTASSTAARTTVSVDRINKSGNPLVRNRTEGSVSSSGRKADTNPDWRSNHVDDEEPTSSLGFVRNSSLLSRPSSSSSTASSPDGLKTSSSFQSVKKSKVMFGAKSDKDAELETNWRSKRVEEKKPTNSVDFRRKSPFALSSSSAAAAGVVRGKDGAYKATAGAGGKDWRSDRIPVDDYRHPGTPGGFARGSWRSQNPQYREPRSSAHGNSDNGEFAAPHERLRALADNSPEEVVCALMSRRSGLLNFFSYSQINDARLVEAMVVALRKACQSKYSPQSLSRLLQMVNESGFLNGPLYQHVIANVHMMSATFVISVVDILKSLLHLLPSSSLPNATQLLSHLHIWKELQPLELDAIASLQSVEEIKRDVTKQIKGGDLVRDQEKSVGDDEEPPDDFRKIPTVPSLAEMKCVEPPFLRANIVYGAYKDVNHYLDVQYRLLREDFICPLREGLRTLQEYMDKNIPVNRLSDIRFYRGVQIITPYCTLKCIMYRTRFDVSQFPRVRWESSKRLIFGSLVGISKDNFETIIFGTVANRDPEHLKKGEVDLCFEDDNAYLIDPNPYTVYQMVECSAYFEAYRHVLQGLQEIESDSLPFKRYLLNQTTEKGDVHVPRYLRDYSKSYNFGCLVQSRPRHLWENVPILSLKDWPSASALGLDDSQYAALQTAMTKEFVTIQGPPGTGKTFIGLKIVHLLLENRRHWDVDQSPILVVCYTNHALDQFLEGIIEMCRLSPGELVRVGGRSSSENQKLKMCGVFNIKKEHGIRNAMNVQNAIYDTREEMHQLQTEITCLVGQVEVARKIVLHEVNLQQYMSEAQAQSLYNYGYPPGCTSIFQQWLCLYQLAEADMEYTAPRNAPEADEEILEDDEEEVTRLQQERQVEENTSVSQRQQHLKSIKEASLEFQQQIGVIDGEVLQDNDDDDDGGGGGPWQSTRTNKKQGKQPQNKVGHKRKLYQPMSEAEWFAVENVWALSLRDRWRLYNCWASSFCEEKSVYVRNLSAQYNRCASRLNELNSEEDYQVLRQARVVGMTTTGAAKYRQLLQRVHPRIVIVEEAAEVMESHVVTTLSARCDHLIMIGDHQQLRPNPTVYTLAKKYHLDISLFERMVKNELHCDRLTIQHRMRPEIVKLIVPHVYKSLSNHESVLEYDSIRGINGNLFFVSHSEIETNVDDTKSKSNDHEARFISSLCLYLLQQGYQPAQITVLTMYTGQMFLLRRVMPKAMFEGVRITPVDNFQGEENDIILLSLVRSNEMGKIGFLQTHNRVCVALSRAKKGLYVIGNMEQMSDASSLWNGIVKDLKANGQLVDALPLACQNHPSNIVYAKKAEDFRKAPEGGCMMDCGYRLQCGHVCTRKCHPTDRQHKDYVCLKPCRKILCDLGHKCPKKCFEDCGKCGYMVEKTVPSCGHIQSMKCHVDPLKFQCQKPCTKLLPCEHTCQEVCGGPCTTQCKVIMKERSWPCGHLLTVACYRNPDNFPCNFSMKRTLPCGHSIHARCSEDLTKIMCSQKVTVCLCDDEDHKHEVVCSQQAEARDRKCTLTVQLSCPRQQKHTFASKCSDRDSQKCPIKCGATLACGHRCMGTCSSCAEAGRHKPCTARCKEILPCQHQCQASCGESCPPCKDRCQLHCGHRPCSKPCGSPCDVCQLPCRWSCPHERCQLRCPEPCTRPPCNRPCNNILQCRHRCIGLCGEPCVPLCGICNSKTVEQIVRYQKVENYSAKKTRFLHLKPCGHVVEVNYMDQWVQNSAPTPPCSPKYVSCPVCKQFVGLCPRYNGRIKTYMRDVNAVKKASSDSSQVATHFNRSVEAFWPDEVAHMKSLLLDPKHTRSETLKTTSRYEKNLSFRSLVLGAVCVWQECWNVLQTCKRKTVKAERYLVEMTEAIDKLKTDVLRCTERRNYRQLVLHVFTLQCVYIHLQARRLSTFINNQRLLLILRGVCAENPLRDHHISTLHLKQANEQLVRNFRIYQRDNIDDFLQYLQVYFQPQLKESLEKKTWLVCAQGHAFSGSRVCGTCTRGGVETAGAAASDPGSVDDSVLMDIMTAASVETRISRRETSGESTVLLEELLKTIRLRLSRQDSVDNDDDDDDEDDYCSTKEASLSDDDVCYANDDAAELLYDMYFD